MKKDANPHLSFAFHIQYQCLGCACNAQALLSDGAASVTGPLGWGLALAGAIYVSGGVSGGHVNPAVSLGMASVGKLAWGKLFHYILAQYVGAFLGAAMAFGVYYEALHAKYSILVVTGNNGSASIFGTMPTSSGLTCFFDQMVATCFFLLIICAITDEKNMKVPSGLVPMAIGFTDLSLIILSFGYNCGAPLNPARDFAPRLFSSFAGWGADVFR